jgi:peroxiredoxin
MLKRSIQDEEINAEELSIHKKYANKLINTTAGSYVFTNSYYLMSTEEKLEILNKMNAQQLQLKQIKDIQTNVEIERKVAPGNRFIDFTLNNTDNTPMSLSQYVGKTNYLLVEFWASWCPDCMRFLPQLSAFYAKHHGKMLEIVGVSLDENKQAWAGAIQRKSIPWVNISDLKGWKSEAAQKYAVSSIPCTFLIDRNGKIIFKNPGLQQLEEIISKGE